MTYNVFGGMLNPTLLRLSAAYKVLISTQPASQYKQISVQPLAPLVLHLLSASLDHAHV